MKVKYFSARDMNCYWCNSHMNNHFIVKCKAMHSVPSEFSKSVCLALRYILKQSNDGDISTNENIKVSVGTLFYHK